MDDNQLSDGAYEATVRNDLKLAAIFIVIGIAGFVGTAYILWRMATGQ